MSLALLSDRIAAISERYAAAFDIDRSGDWALLKLQEEVGELTQAYLAATGRSRRDPESARRAMAMEMADVLCHLLLLARHTGIDIDAMVAEKWLAWEDAGVQTGPEGAS